MSTLVAGSVARKSCNKLYKYAVALVNPSHSNNQQPCCASSSYAENAATPQTLAVLNGPSLQNNLKMTDIKRKLLGNSDRRNSADLLTRQLTTTSSCALMGSRPPCCSSKVVESTSSTTPVCCWNCKADLSLNKDLLVCTKCNKLRNPPDNINYFELFDLPITFTMDLKGLAQNHRNMMRILHPDRFSQSVDEEKALSETWSPLVNEGYACLKKPIRRAKYLLELAGNPIREGEDIVLEPNFYAEIVELNEEIVDAETQTDVAGLVKYVRDVLQTYYDKVEKAFEEGDISKAKSITAHMQYYENLKKKLVQRETEMGVIH